MRHYPAPKNGFETNWNDKKDLILIETVQLKIWKFFKAELRQKLELKKIEKKNLKGQKIYEDKIKEKYDKNHQRRIRVEI